MYSSLYYWFYCANRLSAFLLNCSQSPPQQAVYIYCSSQEKLPSSLLATSFHLHVHMNHLDTREMRVQAKLVNIVKIHACNQEPNGAKRGVRRGCWSMHAANRFKPAVRTGSAERARVKRTKETYLLSRGCKIDAEVVHNFSSSLADLTTWELTIFANEGQERFCDWNGPVLGYFRGDMPHLRTVGVDGFLIMVAFLVMELFSHPNPLTSKADGENSVAFSDGEDPRGRGQSPQKQE